MVTMTARMMLLVFFDRLDFNELVVFWSHVVVFVAFAMMAGRRIGHSTVLLAKLTACADFMMMMMTVMVWMVMEM